MKIKFLILPALALSVLAVPAMAYDYPYNNVPVTGSQLTDKPSERSNVTVSGSFLRPKTDQMARNDNYRSQRAYDEGYRDGYYDRDSDLNR